MSLIVIDAIKYEDVSKYECDVKEKLNIPFKKQDVIFECDGQLPLLYRRIRGSSKPSFLGPGIYDFPHFIPHFTTCCLLSWNYYA